MTDTMPSAAFAKTVLYVLLCRSSDAGALEFLLLEKNGSPTFPPTKLRPRENLYTALIRPLEVDLGLVRGTYALERELDMLPSAGDSHRYPGLQRTYHLYPVFVTLTEEGWCLLAQSRAAYSWMSLRDIHDSIREPNVLRIAEHLQERMMASEPDAMIDPSALTLSRPSMDAMACAWAAEQSEGVRIALGSEISTILAAGNRAFNLRVADPYLPYQRQGLGFTWSFFTPMDKQDIHVHGLPAVEIYGVLKGRMQLWYKPMNQRGVRTWRCCLLQGGDWAEVEPMTCHFACWLDQEGLGTVIKAAGSGVLAGVGRLGVAGKTTCQWTEGAKVLTCSSFNQCQVPPALRLLETEFKKPFAEREFSRIAEVALTALEVQER